MADEVRSGLDSCPVCGKPLHGLEGVCSCPARGETGEFEAIVASARADLDAARSALARGDYRDVELLASRAAEKYGEAFQDSLELRATAMIKSADFAGAASLIEAIEDVERRNIFKLDLTDAEGKDKAAKERFNLALTAARDGRLKEAETQLSEAVSLAPYLVEPYRLLVKVHASLDSMDDARYFFRAIETRFPGDPALFELRRLLDEVSDFEEREAKFRYSPGTLGLMLAAAQIVLIIVILVVLLTR